MVRHRGLQHRLVVLPGLRGQMEQMPRRLVERRSLTTGLAAAVAPRQRPAGMEAFHLRGSGEELVGQVRQPSVVAGAGAAVMAVPEVREEIKVRLGPPRRQEATEPVGEVVENRLVVVEALQAGMDTTAWLSCRRFWPNARSDSRS